MLHYLVCDPRRAWQVATLIAWSRSVVRVVARLITESLVVIVRAVDSRGEDSLLLVCVLDVLVMLVFHALLEEAVALA